MLMKIRQNLVEIKPLLSSVATLALSSWVGGAWQRRSWRRRQIYASWMGLRLRLGLGLGLGGSHISGSGSEKDISPLDKGNDDDADSSFDGSDHQSCLQFRTRVRWEGVSRLGRWTYLGLMRRKREDKEKERKSTRLDD